MITDLLWSRPNAIPILLSILSILVLSSVVRFFRYRLAFHKLHGPLKAPPFNTFFGTIPAIAELYKTSPNDTHPVNTMTLLWRKYELGDMFFLDNWPAAPERQIVINDPVLAAQITQTNSLPKHPLYKEFATHICGKTSMVFSEGEMWKRSRTLFNPGFSASHLMTLVPAIVDDTMVFWENLKRVAESNEVVQLEQITAHLTIDIMGHVILDHDLNSQVGRNRLVDAFQQAISWTPSARTINPLAGLNPVRPLAHWYWTNVMDGYIGRIIDERYQMLQDGKVDKSRKCAIDLALAQYSTQQGSQEKTEAPKIDKSFKEVVIDGMKTFLFAGHDTSSSTICYVYHLLELHPKCLAEVIDEHNEVFGKDTSVTADIIKKNPQLLNKLPYTLAVIKETLRLFPAAITTRYGDPNISITTSDGTVYPTKNFMIWVNIHTIHRRADLFPKPDEFIPERFLPSSTSSATPSSPSDAHSNTLADALTEVPKEVLTEIPKDAYRPFEKGLRSCIGQELALLEMKIVLALTVRNFEICAAYEEWDRKMGREKPGEMLDGRRGMFGYRAYQVFKASAKPSDDMPARVRRRSTEI